MSEQVRESLSALMDGESEELELRRVLAHKDTEMVNQTWRNFHRSQQAIDGQIGEFSHLDIFARVSEAIVDEQFDPIEQFKESEKQPFWLRPIAGLAVAASVMVAVVIGVQSLSPTETGFSTGQPVLASRVYPISVSSSGVGGMAVSAKAQSGIGLPGAQAAADFETQQRLEKLMLMHTEHAALNNGKGLMPYARVASFEVE